MSGLTRRTVLGTAGAIGVTAALAAHGSGASAAPHAGAGAAREGEPYSPAPARAALARLLPDHVDQFRLRLLTDGPGRDAGQRPAGRHDRDRRERFTVTGSTGRVEVAGTSPAVLLTGVHWSSSTPAGRTCRGRATSSTCPNGCTPRASRCAAPPPSRTASPSTTPTTATPRRTPTGTAGSG